MMNFLALYVVSYLVRGPLQEPTGIYPQSATISAAAQLPPLISSSRLHAGVGLAVLAVVVSWLLLEHTAAGFRIRAVGSNPRAAELAGRIDVGRVQRGAFLTSGALAGLAGVLYASRFNSVGATTGSGLELDVVAAAAERSAVPVAAYQVSGEYAMISAAAANGWIDRRAAALESLLSIRRAGAQVVLTYFALEAAGWIG